jgi:hypothetical protein
VSRDSLRRRYPGSQLKCAVDAVCADTSDVSPAEVVRKWTAVKNASRGPDRDRLIQEAESAESALQQQVNRPMMAIITKQNKLRQGSPEWDALERELRQLLEPVEKMWRDLESIGRTGTRVPGGRFSRY